jgi:hypothetical protein
MTWFNSAVRGNSLFITTSDRHFCLASQGQSTKWLPPTIISLGVGMRWLQSLTIGTYPSYPFIICSTSDGSASSLCSLVLSISSIQKLCNLARQLTTIMQLSSQWLCCMELHFSKFPTSKQVFQKRTQLEYEPDNGKKCNYPWNQMKNLGMEFM